MTVGKLKASSLAAFALASANAVAVQSSDKATVVNPTFSTYITLPEATVKVGSPIKVELSLTNTLSSVPVVIYRMGFVPYAFEVRDPNGTLVLLTAQGREWQRNLKESAVKPAWGYADMIKPGETFKDKVVVSDLYDMSKPGAYTIQFYGGPPDRPGVAHSNPVTVTVTK